MNIRLAPIVEGTLAALLATLCVAYWHDVLHLAQTKIEAWQPAVLIVFAGVLFVSRRFFKRGPTAVSDHPTNIYWLGHDLMWTMDAARAGSRRETIAHGLEQSRHHLNFLGTDYADYDVSLLSLLSVVKNQPATDISESMRKKISDEVERLIYRIGGHIQKLQPDFDAGHPERKVLHSDA